MMRYTIIAVGLVVASTTTAISVVHNEDQYNFDPYEECETYVEDFAAELGSEMQQCADMSGAEQSARCFERVASDHGLL